VKKSIHAKRMERKHRQTSKTSKLNLVSLMDIFTILVFFLLVNSSDVEVLDYLAARKPYKDEEAEKLGRDVNIMADKDTPYSLLKKVMATCAKAEYRNISLAVSQVENKAEPIVVGDGSVGE